ncbi:MAG: DUF1643 domain-containing protein [Capsulimonas sp.]|uniref:DUF1643 domain-containing protein n=1 Tax=Capsulimonas sp. TaxID=2494211 RepID=UPI0032665017
MVASSNRVAEADRSIELGAEFSADRRYRYSLWRMWGAEAPLMFVGLNPSTADENEDDNTIRKCRGFARRLGYGGLIMVNLFAYRATDPREMKRAADPIGAENDEKLIAAAGRAGGIIAAWGAHGEHMERCYAVHSLLTSNGFRLQYLALTKDGQPRHPLYLPGHLEPKEF